MGKSGYPVAQSIAAPFSVVAGLILYWLDSGGLQLVWITTPTGLGITVGAVTALAALSIGLGIARPAGLGMAALGTEIQSARKPPTPEQITKMKALQERVTKASIWIAFLLAATVAAMAMARYL